MMKSEIPWRMWSILGGLIVLAGWAMAEFVIPSEVGQEAAVGSLNGLNPVLRRTFSNHGEFEAKKETGTR